MKPISRCVFFICLFFSTFLTAQDLSRGLIAYYPFDIDATDHSEYTNHGKVFGAKLVDEARCGSPAYKFNGIDDYIDFGNAEILNQNFSGLTVSFWMKPTRMDPEDFGLIIGKWAFNANNDHWGVFMTVKNSLDFTVADGAEFGYGMYTKRRVVSHEWVHVIMVWNKSKKLGAFFDGTLDGFGEQNGLGINTESKVSLKMGRQIVGQERPYEGYIDNVKIWGRSLTFEEIQLLWEEENTFCNKVLLQGRTLNEVTNEPVAADVYFELHTDKKATAHQTTNNEDGAFEQHLILDRTLAVYAKAKGYLSQSVNLSTKGYKPGDILYRDLYLVPIEIGSSVTLNNIFFEFDKAVLQDESFAELNLLLEILNDNPTITVEIGGHTDSKGSDDYNQELSERRAEAVRTYLLQYDIPEERIVAKGYGEVEPVDTNDTDEGRQNNRRVEFKIIGI